MTNRLAIALALLILCFFIVDYFVYDLTNSVFLGRKFVELVDYVAFWR